METFTAFVFLVAILLNAAANILIKASSVYGEQGHDKLEIIRQTFLNPWFIFGVACFGLALIAYRYVLAQGMRLSVAYPIMTTGGFAVVLLASRYLFHEELNWIQWSGIGLLVLGIWMIASQISAS